MSYYVCKNEECENYNVKDVITCESFKYVSNVGLVGEHAACPKCGKIREYINPAADVPLSEKEVGFGMYSSKTAEQKREILQKRAHEHFTKKVKERKDHLMNQAMTEMKGIGKR